MITVKCEGEFYSVFDTNVDTSTIFKLSDIIQITDKVIDCEVVTWKKNEKGIVERKIEYRNQSNDFESILGAINKILLETEKSVEINLQILCARNRI